MIKIDRYYLATLNIKHRNMTNTDVIKKLLGNINPSGQSHLDDERYDNLLETIKVIDNLIQGVCNVSDCSTRHETSMNRSGNLALNYLDNLGVEIKEYIGDEDNENIDCDE